MLKLATIAIGGGIGAILRYSVSGVTHKLFGSVFPLGTLAVNLIGSLIIGFLWGLFEKIAVTPQIKLLVLVGILGAFTTFSTYTLESLHLFRDGEVKLAVFNILLNNVCGMVMVFVGLLLARQLVSA